MPELTMQHTNARSNKQDHHVLRCRRKVVLPRPVRVCLSLILRLSNPRGDVKIVSSKCIKRN